MTLDIYRKKKFENSTFITVNLTIKRQVRFPFGKYR